MSNRDSQDAESFDIGDAKVQKSGLLLKRPFGHKSAKWQKRFFIVKEGFLLYYSDTDAKIFEKTKHFNIHPKGVIPLGGCSVEECPCGSQKFTIKITNEHFKGEVWVGAETQEDCTAWVKALQDAGRVTWKNAQVGDTIIHQMEQKTQKVAQEMKDTIDKLNDEASALVQEKEKKAELEALAAKLEAEKRAIEEAAMNLRTEKEITKLELQNTLATMSKVQEERDSLSMRTQSLEANLQMMEQQRQKVLAELQEKEKQAKELDEEKEKLAKTTASLKDDIDSLEEKRKLLEKEKEVASLRLNEQMEAAKQLEEEKKQMADAAISLQQNLEQVALEKEVSELKWKEERKRRLKTEQRLKLAEDALKRLDKALKDSGVHIDMAVETDVKNLRSKCKWLLSYGC